MLQLIAQSQFGKGLTDPSNYFGANDSATGTNALSNLETLISNMIGLITVLGGLFFVFFFIQGGLSWVTAGGDSGKIDKARGQMTQGVVGLVVLVAAYAIIGLIGSVVGLNLLNPAASLAPLIPRTSDSTGGFNSFGECIDAGNSFEYCDGL